MFLEILLKVIGIFILVLMGVAAGKTYIIPKQAIPAFNGFLLNFAIPCLILSFMQVDDLSSETMRSMLGAFGAFAAATVAMGLLSFVFIMPMKLKEEDKGIYRLQVAFTNSGFMAIPLVTVIFGKSVLFLTVMNMTVFNLLMYSFGIILITYEKGKPLFDRRMLRNLINVPIIAALVGVVIFLTGFHFPDFINMGIDLMSDTVSPLAMFIVGVNLSYSQFGKLFTKKNFYFCFLSLVLVPAATFGICMLLPISSDAFITVVFAMAMPSPAIAPVLAAKYGRDQIQASETVASTTIFSLVTLPVIAYLLLKMFM